MAELTHLHTPKKCPHTFFLLFRIDRKKQINKGASGERSVIMARTKLFGIIAVLINYSYFAPRAFPEQRSWSYVHVFTATKTIGPSWFQYKRVISDYYYYQMYLSCFWQRIASFVCRSEWLCWSWSCDADSLSIDSACFRATALLF